MTTYEIYFSTLSRDEHRAPYVRGGDTVVYNCDGKEGTLEFNGYYYVENDPPPYPEDADTSKKPWEKPQRYPEWLPKKVHMSMTYKEKEPYKTKYNALEKSTYAYYNELEKHQYIIEIYKKESYESTDEISEIEDEDGDTMRVCFFPTNKLKIWFRVIEDLTSIESHTYRIKKPNTIYANKDSFKRILAWGNNDSESWYHPVSRAQFSRTLTTVKVGDVIEFILDGAQSGVEVLEIGEIYDYPGLKHIYGDFNIGDLIVDRVLLVKRVSAL